MPKDPTEQEGEAAGALHHLSVPSVTPAASQHHPLLHTLPSPTIHPAALSHKPHKGWNNLTNTLQLFCHMAQPQVLLCFGLLASPTPHLAHTENSGSERRRETQLQGWH